MPRPNKTMLRIGDWTVNPMSGEISRNGDTSRLDARALRLLVCLAERAGEVVSIDDLLSQVWPDVIVSPDSVYQAVTSLRRLLGDDPKRPRYIATVPRMGYRMVAKVGPLTESTPGPEPRFSDRPPAIANAQTLMTSRRRRRIGISGIAGALFLAIVVLLVARLREKGQSNAPNSTAVAAQRQRTVAVLPFLDLTEGMQEEEFSDGMTEELIDKLSKVGSLRVPSATSSFYYKGKQTPVADVAKALGVAYVLDGSVRKSGARLRVAARLVHTDSGYVVWSETYDRPFLDRLMVQDDIANEVAKALSASIAPGPR